ncbi:patatin-like phospholipase family protein [Roseibium sediminicola]|uniref:Patatin-like phospholipase family protein n=1 Tax=Roseibium sediminicola TaxID=2933272 RepID=A0ABT0H2F0_9HYPH|nr:patatin-like phospholipase family protein [Roseibium sp. CAU 1639]MCK7615857.1 patatin-like phospholipase family protein [Roseibium sp. CAU 1639]
MKRDKSTPEALRLNLALQGGGAHGAFTWGVLDRLLEEDRFAVNAVSGTSAGAMNAAALVSGLMRGGREEARRSLESFWRKVSSRSRFNPFNMSTAQAVLSSLGIDRDTLPALFSSGTPLFSPYDLNPAGFNPLREIIQDTVDLEAIARAPIGLYVTATHVASGEARIFSNDAISADVLLASACLPALFHAVEIDGAFYWDGGYTGNPSLMPLVPDTGASDLLLVQTSPTWRADVPQDARQIALREKEISFNAPLIKDLRLLAELQRQACRKPPVKRVGFLSGRGKGKGKTVEHLTAHSAIADLRLHRITGAGMNGRSGQSKLNSAWAFLKELRDEGRHAAGEFLTIHGRDLGHRSSLDLTGFLQSGAETTETKAKAS